MKKIKIEKTKKEYVGVKLTDLQAETVKSMIVASMEKAYTDKTGYPDMALYQAANQIADSIVLNTQKALIQDFSFKKVIAKSGPVKKAVKKEVKKVVKKTKKTK